MQSQSQKQVGKKQEKAKNKEQRQQKKREGKWTFPSKKDSDYEHAGVGIAAIHRKSMNHLEELKEIIGRIVLLIFEGAGGSIAFVCTYAPTTESKDKDKDAFYDMLAKAVEEEKGSFLYIAGDFNSRIFQRQSHEKKEIGQHF